MGARYYEPNSGRFISPDPLGHAASMGLYDYAGGDPINFVDPQGRSALNPGQGIITSSYSTYLGGQDSAIMLGGLIDIQGAGFPKWFTQEEALYKWQAKPGYALPPNLSDANFADGYDLGIAWKNGAGPAIQNFGPGSPMVEDLMERHHVVAARNFVGDHLYEMDMNGAIYDQFNGQDSIMMWPYDVGGVSGVLLYFNDYTELSKDQVHRGIYGEGDPNANITVAYLGSFGLKAFVLSIDPATQTGLVRFQVFNDSMLTSATHPPILGYTDWWKNKIEPHIESIQRQFS